MILTRLLPPSDGPRDGSAAGTQTRARVVDFGCGSGNLVLAMAALMPHCDFVGVDMKVGIAMGESGNVFSPHYDDLLPIWGKYGYVAIPTSPDAVKQIAVHRFTLEPQALGARASN